jgi:predicted ribosome quality control (RQC) complex YloA/Tae2 family protein
MMNCTICNVDLVLGENFQEGNKRQRRYYCNDCSHDKNTERMWVNGKYIPKTHPLYKPGRFKTLDDAWSHTEIDTRSTAGEVYIIRNPAFTNWLKVGKAVSSEDRLNGYQTSSPFRDYVLEYYETFDNRHQAEAEIHRMLEKHKHCLERRGEWFKTYIPTVREVMNEYRAKENGIGHRNQSCPQHDLDLCNS